MPKSTLQALVEETLTKEEFVRSFENVLNFVKKIDKKQDLLSEKLVKDFEDLKKSIEESLGKDVDKMGRDFSTLTDKMEAKLQSFIHNVSDDFDSATRRMIDKIDEKILSIKDGDDGKDADEQRIIEEVERRVKSELAGIKKELKQDVKAIPTKPAYQIFGPGKTKIVKVDLSSQLDGSTKTFALGITHFGIVGAWGSSSPFIFRPDIDYTESGKSIVFDDDIDETTALAAGQSLIVHVLK